MTVAKDQQDSGSRSSGGGGGGGEMMVKTKEGIMLSDTNGKNENE